MALQRAGIVVMGARRVKAQSSVFLGGGHCSCETTNTFFISSPEVEKWQQTKHCVIAHHPPIRMNFVRIILQNWLSGNWPKLACGYVFVLWKWGGDIQMKLNKYIRSV